MRTGSLQRLLQVARALPGDRDPVPAPRPAFTLAPESALTPGQGGKAPALAELRAQVGALLTELAERVEPALCDALSRASSAWDQADAAPIVDDELRARAAALAERWRAAAGAWDPGTVAAALEALLAIEAALGVVAVVERRLATLIRLRLADGAPLLPDGRPFLDVPAALREAAGAWA
jgi:hypothetical protein